MICGGVFLGQNHGFESIYFAPSDKGASGVIKFRNPMFLENVFFFKIGVY